MLGKKIFTKEALNRALWDWDMTLVFVSHDREVVSSLATRVLEIKADRVMDFQRTYLKYMGERVH